MYILVGPYSEHHGLLFVLLWTFEDRSLVGGGWEEGGTEIIEDKKESDLTVCPRLLTNFVCIIKLFVGTWIFLLTYHFLEYFPFPPSSWLLREHLYSYHMTPAPCHS